MGAATFFLDFDTCFPAPAWWSPYFRGMAGKQRMCSRWASIFSYDASTAAEPNHILCGMASGCFAFLTFLLEVFDASKGVLSRSHAFPTLACVPVLAACVCRARATVGRPAPRCRAGLRRHRPHFFRRQRRRCGRRQRPLSQPPRYGNPLPASTSLFWYIFQRAIGTAPPCMCTRGRILHTMVCSP